MEVFDFVLRGIDEHVTLLCSPRVSVVDIGELNPSVGVLRGLWDKANVP